MKKELNSLLLFVLLGISAYSQCDINPFIQENYELDAKVLAMREILIDPLDPDYNNPFLPEERVVPYLEKLSAIYENPTNNSSIDSLFNEFQIHANWEYHYPSVPFKMMEIVVNDDSPWIETFLASGISGNEELDNLMLDYQFVIDHSFELPSAGWIIVYLETNFNFLNITALLDEFLAVDDVELSYSYIPFEDRFNYTGIPYIVGLIPADVCDIYINDDVYTFALYSGDCHVGCIYSKSWNLQVTEDCEVTLLSTPNNSLTNFSIYPNPTTDYLTLSGLTDQTHFVTIYNIQGQIVKTSSLENKTVDVSILISGMYFLIIQTNDGENSIQKFIKF